MSKTIIAPLVGFVVLFLQVAFNVKIPKDVQTMLVDVLVTGASLATVLYGIFKNHQKKE
jgi:hypothetical protein